MYKRIFGFLLLLFSIQFSSAQTQLQSPEQFLGYKVGTRFTPHWKIIDYFKSVAAAMPNMVKMQQYGQTNEGRPLMVFFVSTPANISNLENIRTNNLKLAASLPGDKSGGSLNSPVIVWLSYNVHGNEASSSEASMLTIYSLLDPSYTQTKQWLQNTVVVIDPCINPDGRDRYVNWYNSIEGSNYNPAPEAREHREPWPGGRVNHYNFDLNRDWAWQTQVETQQRLALFNSWLPEVHVDFHEMGVNSPYYFAPAAQPYHQVITKWQRDFQNTIGRNHAKYFDAKGWLYFTKEEYDLLYPSYGDTYPIYNGAIGMTYEQAGGPAGGLGVLNNYGDTLTLTDRAMHHYTTGLSTIEVASQNAAKLMTEFQNFFKNNTTVGVGNYKSYVVKLTPNDTAKLYSLVQLLERNNILYYSGKPGNFRGYNYDSGKDEGFSVDTGDLVIPSVQPKSTLVDVLFEPNVVLVDSATYDITAWSLPYVYGLKAYATKDKIATNSSFVWHHSINTAMDGNPYGYAIRWNGMPSAQLVAQLLKKGIKLRYTDEPFEMNGQTFDRGTVIVLKTSNQFVGDLWNTVRELANQAKVRLVPVTTGFVDKGYDFGSSRIRPLKARRVALITGEGVSSTSAGEVWFYFDKLLNYPVTLINANDISRVNWNNYDVVILPDGNYRFLADRGITEQFKSWINGGGHVIAMENAVAQLARQDWAIKSKKADDSDTNDIYSPLKPFEERDRDQISNTTPGSIYKVELDNTHPLAFGYPNYYYTLKQDDAIYNFIKEDGWNVGVIKKEKAVAGFVGSHLKNRLKDGLIFGVQDLGNGTITYLADDVLFRSFWENGKLLFTNAVFLVGE